MRLAPGISRGLGLAFGGAALVLFVIAWAFAAAIGQQVLQLLLFGLVLGVLLLLLPLGPLLLLLALLTFVVQGSTNYFLKFHQAQWLPYLLCIVVSMRVVQFGGSPGPSPRGAAGPAWSTPPVICLLLYLFALVAATLIFRPPAAQLVVALKNALPIWAASALVFQAGRSPELIDRLWSALRWIFFLQLPVVLVQHVVIVPRRHDALTTGSDGVVGTFGGMIDGGGASATLVMFALLVMAYQLALWLRRESTTARLLLYWVTGLVIILSGEVKAALVWLPLVVVYVARKRIFSGFGTAIVAILVTGSSVAGIYAAYDALYWQHYKVGRDADLLSRAEYFFDVHNVNPITGEISRGASIALWAQDPGANLATRVVGYGPGASRISATGGLGEIARRYAPLDVSATTAALVLWDSGLLGALALLGVIGGTWAMLRRHSSDRWLHPREQAASEALGAALLVMSTLFFYNHYLNDEPSTQLLLALAVGMALRWRATSAARRASASATPVNQG